METYLQGETATLLVQFYAYPGGPAEDQSGVQITISPTGGGAAVVGPTSTGVVNEATGLYSYAWTVPAAQTPGTYVVEWTADGDVDAAETIEVAAMGSVGWAPDYATVSQVRGQLRIDDTADDTQIATAITAASRAIDTHTNRQFGIVATAEVRYYTARPSYSRGQWIVDIDDLMTTVGFSVTSDGTALTAYQLEPRNAAVNGRPWTRLAVETTSAVLPEGTTAEIAATGRWGWLAVPTAVHQACLLQAARFLARRDSPYGVAGSPDLGNEMRLLSRLDPDVAVALRGYVRPRTVA